MNIAVLVHFAYKVNEVPIYLASGLRNKQEVLDELFSVLASIGVDPDS